MRQFGQAQSDQMRLRSMIEGAVASVIDSVNTLDASLAPVAKSGDYADLTGTPDLSIYAESADLAAVATSGDYADLTGAPDLSIYAESADLASVATSGSYADLTGTPDLSGYAESADLAAVATSGAYSDLIGTPSLAGVATSGAYSDLTGKPTLGTLAAQSSVTTSQISDWATATSSFLTAHQDISGLLPKAGGTMSGAVEVNTNILNGFVRRTATSGYLLFSGGTSSTDGAVLILSGGTRTGYEGLFRLSARDGNSTKNLDGWPDGTLTWDGDAVATQPWVSAQGFVTDISGKQDALATEAVAITLPEVTELTTHNIVCYRYGKVVMVYIAVTLSAALSSATTVATGLPAPAHEIYQVVNTWASSYRRPIRARITTGGDLTFQYGYATSYNHVLTYLAA